GIPVLRGREFNATDGPAAPPVIVINQTMARQLFANEDPAGRRVQMATPSAGTPNPWSTIVGVIGDVRHSGLEAPPSPEMYIPGLQGPPSNPFSGIRTPGAPAALAATVRAEVQAVDKTIAA